MSKVRTTRRGRSEVITDELFRNVNKMARLHKDKEFKKRFRKTMRDSAVPFYENMKTRVPVDTGALKKSLGIRVSTKASRGYPIGFSAIGSVKYRKGKERDDAIKAMAVEFGTKYRQATPFIRPSINHIGLKLKSFRIISSGLKQLLKDYDF